MASANGDREIFHLLFDYGVNINVQDKVGQFPSFSNFLIPYLQSPPPSIQDSCTALLYSCMQHHHQIAEELLANEARVNLSDKVCSHAKGIDIVYSCFTVAQALK